MKLACVISTPDVKEGPLALLTGTFEEKLAKAKDLGYDGVELMICDPSKLDSDDIRSALARHGLEVPQIVTGELFGTEGLALVHPDPAICETAMQRAKGVIEFAGALGGSRLVGWGREAEGPPEVHPGVSGLGGLCHVSFRTHHTRAVQSLRG